MQTKSFHICDARPTGGKAGKGNNKTSTVQVFDDTDTDCAFLIKMFRFKVGDLQSYVKAKQKARTYVKALLTPRAADETVWICSRCGTTNVKSSQKCWQCEKSRR